MNKAELAVFFDGEVFKKDDIVRVTWREGKGSTIRTGIITGFDLPGFSPGDSVKLMIDSSKLYASEKHNISLSLIEVMEHVKGGA